MGLFLRVRDSFPEGLAPKDFSFCGISHMHNIPMLKSVIDKENRPIMTGLNYQCLSLGTESGANLPTLKHKSR